MADLNYYQRESRQILDALIDADGELTVSSAIDAAPAVSISVDYQGNIK